jgi:hypothetical protein
MGVCGGNNAPLLMMDMGRVISICSKLEELNIHMSTEDFENPLWDLSQVDSIGAPVPVPRIWACTHDTLQHLKICLNAGMDSQNVDSGH